MKKDNSYVYMVLLMLSMLIGGCIYTIVQALTNPIKFSQDFNRNYHNLNHDINSILRSNIAFKKNNAIEFLAFKNNIFFFKVTNKKKQPLKIKAIITRPVDETYKRRINMTCQSNALCSLALKNNVETKNLFLSILDGNETFCTNIILNAKEQTFTLRKY